MDMFITWRDDCNYIATVLTYASDLSGKDSMEAVKAIFFLLVPLTKNMYTLKIPVINTIDNHRYYETIGTPYLTKVDALLRIKEYANQPFSKYHFADKLHQIYARLIPNKDLPNCEGSNTNGKKLVTDYLIILFNSGQIEKVYGIRDRKAVPITD